MGQGKANIQILCYEDAQLVPAQAGVRTFEWKHFTGKKSDASLVSKFLASQGILPSPLNCVQGMHSNKEKKYCPFVERKFSKIM